MDTRNKDVDWNIGDRKYGATWEMVKAAVLMDIRDELKRLNAVLYCANFLAIPKKLDRICRNTSKPSKAKRKWKYDSKTGRIHV